MFDYYTTGMGHRRGDDIRVAKVGHNGWVNVSDVKNGFSGFYPEFFLHRTNARPSTIEEIQIYLDQTKHLRMEPITIEIKSKKTFKNKIIGLWKKVIKLF